MPIPNCPPIGDMRRPFQRRIITWPENRNYRNFSTSKQASWAIFKHFPISFKSL